MGYNHAKAEKEFYREWRKKLRLYRKEGMTLMQILPLYKFDKAALRSNRRFYEHCEPLQNEETNLLYSTEMELDSDTYNMNNWTAALPFKLRTQLDEIPEERLKAFYLCRVCGFTQEEISSILLKSQPTIHRWIVQITEIINEFRKNE